MKSKYKLSRKSYFIFSRIKGYRGMIKMLYSLRKFDKEEIAKQRLKIIEFYERYGESATKEAFGADRKVISRWRKRFKESGYKLASLIPRSTRPKVLRVSNIPVQIINFIKEVRMKHPRLGKEKIKPLLDEYCRRNNIKTISESSIGNVIKRNKFFFQKSGRVYHNPASKWAEGKVNKKRRERIKHPPKVEEFGHILSDTIEIITDGIKDYFYCAIDAKMKFALTLNYKRLDSRRNKDFYKRFKSVYPCKIRVWQTDNGCENLGEFDKELEKDNVKHIFSYPRCPKINTYIERYNRTVQEEFINNNLDIINDKKLFNEKLADYIIFYNTKRVHKSLGNKTPINYLLEKGVMSQMSLTYR